ncbi:MAG: FtsH protease activity modulator HflK [Limnochordales bacterium]|nr:FtsH protease activity modulator HflK [Limnochordales bacterium]
MNEFQGQVFEAGGGEPLRRKPGRLLPWDRWPVLIAVLLALWLLLPGTGIWYTVPAAEQGRVYTLGAPGPIADPGLHFKLPAPIQSVRLFPHTRVDTVQVGFQTQIPARGDRQLTYTSQVDYVLTRDQNMIHVEYAVQYTYPESWKHWENIEDFSALVRGAAEAAMRATVATHTVDEVLTTQKDIVQQEAQTHLQSLLRQVDSGVQVLNVQLQSVVPPEPVRSAFAEVQNAIETRATLVNQAQAYQNAQLAEAQGKVAEILAKAEAYAAERINRARGDAARFTQLYEEYRKSPDVTRERLYNEMLQQVLPNVKEIYITDSAGVLYQLKLDDKGE